MTNETLNAMKTIQKFVRKYDIKFTAVTPALRESFLLSIDLEKLQGLKKKIWEAFGEVHDFLYFGHPLTDCRYYHDPRHINYEGMERFLTLVRLGTQLTAVPRPLVPLQVDGKGIR